MRFSISYPTKRLALLMVAALTSLFSNVAQAQFTTTTNSDGTLNISGYSGSGGAVTVPGTINGVTVTTIGRNVFGNKSSLTSVTISPNITSIGSQAFVSCANLASVTLPNTLTTITQGAFENCPNLTSIAIPSSVTLIGTGAFAACSNLTAINVDPTNPRYSSPDGVLIDDSLSALDQYPLGNTGANYTVPGTVTSIQGGAFQGCLGLVTVVIPASVNLVLGGSFSGCTNLTGIYFLGNAPNDDDELLFVGDNNLTVYYLPGTSGWSNTYFAPVPAVLAGAPAITTEPSTQAVLASQNASFTVAATGTPSPTCQWQVSTDGGNTWTNVSGSEYAGATTTTLSVTNPSSALLGYQYEAVLSSPAGTVITAPVPLVVGTSIAKLAWLQSNFTTAQLGNPSIVGDLATPANDGIPNLLKYALNLNALANAQGLLPPPTIVNGLPSLAFQAPQADLTYTVQASTDLFNWSTANVTTQTTGGQVTDSYNQAGATPVFLKLVVTPLP